jgi:hypothetical protein
MGRANRASLPRMATTTRQRQRQQQSPPPAPPQQSRVVTWTQVVTLLTAVVALLTTLVGFATGVFRLSGGTGVFSSGLFWSVYGGLLILLVTGVADFVILQSMKNRLATRAWSFTGSEPPTAFYILAHVVWFALVVPYLFSVGGLAAQQEYAGAGVLLFFIGLFGLVMGGMVVADWAFEVDKTVKPWAYYRPER